MTFDPGWRVIGPRATERPGGAMATLERPNQYRYLRVWLTAYLMVLPTAKPKVFELFRHITGLPDADARRVLREGTLPIVKMRQTGPRRRSIPCVAGLAA